MVKVSVIIPFYNQNPEFLKQALSSVLCQTVKDIEVICIDDGSDNSVCYDYIKSLKQNDSRVILYKKHHEGAGFARNMGITLSSGENIMFLDSDDFYPQNDILEKLYNLKNNHNVLIVGGKHQLLKNNIYEEPYFNYGNINDFFCNKIVSYQDYQFPWWYWCFMFDASLIKDNHIYFPPFIRYQDPPFFVKLMTKAKIFYAADIVSYVHRDSEKLYNMTPEMAKAHIIGIKYLLNYSKENNLNKLYNLLKSLFYSFDLQILEKVDGLPTEFLDIQKKEIENI